VSEFAVGELNIPLVNHESSVSSSGTKLMSTVQEDSALREGH